MILSNGDTFVGVVNGEEITCANDVACYDFQWLSDGNALNTRLNDTNAGAVSSANGEACLAMIANLAVRGTSCTDELPSLCEFTCPNGDQSHVCRN